jgi:hypothetical protein
MRRKKILTSNISLLMVNINCTEMNKNKSASLVGMLHKSNLVTFH